MPTGGSMSPPTLVFSHANGFPARSYRKMFSFLEPHFTILHIDRLGHDPRYPVSDGWPHLVAELVDFVSRRAAGPVIGAGHSLGGYLSFLAAVQRPDLFASIVLLDSPMLGFWTGSAFAMIKRFGLADRVTPAGVTRERRREWASLQDAEKYFTTRKAFRSFDPDCIRDYLEAGTLHADGRVRLAFDPDVEYRIYRAIPHDFAAYLPRLRVPAGFIGGRQSNEIKRVGLRLTRRHFRVDQVEGGHLFPLEYPQSAADALRRMIASLPRTPEMVRPHRKAYEPQ